MIPTTQRAASAYADVGVQTQARSAHDPYQLVALMFEGVLESISVARGALQKKDIPGKLKAVDRALRILQVGLQANLDLEKGGELAANLAALYDYCITRLVLGNSRNDDALLAEVAALIKEVAEGWSEIGPAKAAAVMAAATPAVEAALDLVPVPPPAVTTPPRRLNSAYGSSAAGVGTMAVRA